MTGKASIRGMMYLYAGQRETGAEIVRWLMYNLVCRHGYAFDESFVSDEGGQKDG